MPDVAERTVREIRNPAEPSEHIGGFRDHTDAQIDAACAAAAKAWPSWRAVPAPDRARLLMRYRELLERDFLKLSKSVVRENGKLLSEAKGSVRRGIDVVEFACGIPSQLMGRSLTDVSRDVDGAVHREPVGVVAGVTPFNFPAMIPLWMMPIALACGNAFLLKPSEKTPITATCLVELLREAGAPKGVVDIVYGGPGAVDRLIRNEHVAAVSSVGSTGAAEAIYRTASSLGKRVQALGGAKNHLLVMPDADLERSVPALIGSTFGCAGQRCLAGSVLVAVGDEGRQDEVVDAFVSAARKLVLGDGLDEKATMGPVLNGEQRNRILAWIDRGEKEGARLALDGRTGAASSRPNGFFIGPTVFDRVKPGMAIAREEIFGPVVAVLRARDLDEAIDLANGSPYGNSASIFTQSGAAARAFRARIQCGMLGVNLGVPAPMAFFSFGGWKRSLFGDLHAHGPDAVDFYTRKKVVTERWFGAEAPKEGWV